MTVKELRRELAKFNDFDKVVISTDIGIVARDFIVEVDNSQRSPADAEKGINLVSFEIPL